MMKNYKTAFDNLFKELNQVVVGQNETIKQVLICILCDSNALLEGAPGLAKTLAVKTLSELMELQFSRIQSTPDLMPSDITGTYLVEENRGKREFRFEQGPIFSNIVLADEINRATPKTQSALLEAMQEKQVSVGKQTFPLDKPFFVLATQNPIEQEGTYPLPEAQQDRFLLKILVDYPSFDDEMKIVDLYTEANPKVKLKPMLNKTHIISLQEVVRQMPIAADLKKRAVTLVQATRKNKELMVYGASPRASIGLILAAKANALIEGRSHVSTSDIESMAYPILRHRIILNFEAERKGMKPDDVIAEVLKKVK
ncbi:MoxR family ATPase [Candidatus Woesearchaeota archaeon]|nr:MoxR family ATPase [Candidatus Woesearchaeota archaeon]